jgi:hypothetical protein
MEAQFRKVTKVVSESRIETSEESETKRKDRQKG